MEDRFKVTDTRGAMLLIDSKTKSIVCSMCVTGRQKDQTRKMADVMAKALNDAVNKKGE